MQQKHHACVKYVRSRVTLYYSCKVDIRWKRAIHNCNVCDSVPFQKLGAKCNAIHYGYCTAVTVPLPAATGSRRKAVIRKSPLSIPVDIPIYPAKPKNVTHIPVTSVRSPGSPVSPSIQPRSPGSPIVISVSPRKPDAPTYIKVTPGKPAPNTGTVISVASINPTIPSPVTVVTENTPKFPVPHDSSSHVSRVHPNVPSKVVSVYPSVQYTHPYPTSPSKVTPAFPNKSVYTNTPVSVYPNTPGSGFTNTPASGFTNNPASGYTNTPVSVYANTPASGYTNTPGSVYTNTAVPVSQTRATTPVTIYQSTPGSFSPTTPGSVYKNTTVTVSPSRATTPAVIKISTAKPNAPVITISPKRPTSPTIIPVSPIKQKVSVLLPIQPEDDTDSLPPFPVDPAIDQIPQQPVPIVTKDAEIKPSIIKHGGDQDRLHDAKDQETGKDGRHIIITNSLHKKDNKLKLRELPQPKQKLPSSANIPKFYFPHGKPVPAAETDALLKRVGQEFSKHEGGKVYKDKMSLIAKACGLPLFWKCPLFRAAGGGDLGYITFQSFSTMWKKIIHGNHDLASRFLRLLSKPGVNHLVHTDFEPLVQDIVETHPGLTFLLDAPEFHSRYVNTVISRIYFCANRSWSGKLTVQELRKSNFLQTLEVLEREDDINQITDYFSYEHFYVIYCKFWELDKDHDLFISKADLYRHNDHALSIRVIDRIFSGAVTRGSSFQENKLSYTEFVWFLIAEEDKKHPTSVEYWFRCMDFDGDGVISMYEMEFFYEEQMQKMEALGIEKLPFEDCLCQMLDLVRPATKDRITLQDLKNCKLTDIFFDTFFNLDKFLDHEQRDPFANLRDPELDGPEPSDWEKYAAEEYEILVVEEGANEHELDEIIYEDDFEVDEDELLDKELVRVDAQTKRQTINRGKPATTDDIYDFSTKNLGY